MTEDIVHRDAEWHERTAARLLRRIETSLPDYEAMAYIGAAQAHATLALSLRQAEKVTP